MNLPTGPGRQNTATAFSRRSISSVEQTGGSAPGPSHAHKSSTARLIGWAASFLGLALLCGCETGRRTNATLHEVRRWELVTNSTGRIQRYLVFRETWRDASSVRFCGLLTDPAIAGWTDQQTNQAALGGGYRISFGTATSKIDSAAIQATGTAVGNVVGAAIKTAVKP